MSIDSIDLKIVSIFTVGFFLASLLGYLSQRAKLSPILGYLISGFLIGPYSPGFVADLKMSEQLAEIGVILMMFSVGLHFKWQDLAHFKKTAIFGAIGQTSAATLIIAVCAYAIGWPLETGIIFGFAIGVASTVVMLRLLQENELLKTTQGHIAMGWLIMEDLITVFILILVPLLATTLKGGVVSFSKITLSILVSLMKFIILAVIIFTVGKKFIQYILSRKAITESKELFIVTILAITFLITTSSTLLFSTSIALGAFIAGMVIGLTDVRHRVSMQTLPLRDVFMVIFFLSIGMLFNPLAILDNVYEFLFVLAVILIIKPVVAFGITLFCKHTYHTALTVAIALSQIGEFSFILGEQALRFHILPHCAYDIIVACSIVSIALNPLFFRFLPK